MRIELQAIEAKLINNGLSNLLPMLKTVLNDLSIQHGDMNKWQEALENLPQVACHVSDNSINLPAVTVSSSNAFTEAQHNQLLQSLLLLKPWRKGPFQLFDVFIDTEWRSNIKWQRIAKAIEGGDLSLTDKTILDVGCGNGYYGFKMLDYSPKFFLGIDPSIHYCYQFELINHYYQSKKMEVLPLTLEHFFDNHRIEQKQRQQFQGFDVVFSMGVLYHRKSPIDHLMQLKQMTAKGGQLIMETLIIESDDENHVLLPENRYAGMTNVWFIPSIAALKKWMIRCGFVDVKVLDVSMTTVEEQRKTEWVDSFSLDTFLAQQNDEMGSSNDLANRHPVRVVISGMRA